MLSSSLMWADKLMLSDRLIIPYRLMLLYRLMLSDKRVVSGRLLLLYRLMSSYKLMLSDRLMLIYRLMLSGGLVSILRTTIKGIIIFNVLVENQFHRNHRRSRAHKAVHVITTTGAGAGMAYQIIRCGVVQSNSLQVMLVYCQYLGTL